MTDRILDKNIEASQKSEENVMMSASIRDIKIVGLGSYNLFPINSRHVIL